MISEPEDAVQGNWSRLSTVLRQRRNLYCLQHPFGILSGNGVDGFHARRNAHSGCHGIVLSFRKGVPDGR